MENTQKSQLSLRSKWMYWKRSAANLLRMGHCAPTVMQTLLDISGTQKEWLVKLSTGMPGGIGNTGVECGAVTSPLALMGLNDGLHEMDRGLPVIFDHGYAFCQHFLKCHKTLHCKQIRKDDHFPKHCIRPVCLSPQLFLASRANHSQAAIPPEEGNHIAGFTRTGSKRISTVRRQCFDISGTRLQNIRSYSLLPPLSWAGLYSWA